MKGWLLLVLALGSVYMAWGKYQEYQSMLAAQSAGPYIVVYGRDSCGFTAELRQYLQSRGQAFQYYSVDDAAAADTLHARMEAQGLSTRRYLLPMVDVNGLLIERPEPALALATYQGR